MNRKMTDVLWLCISIVSFLFMSATFLLMPFDNTTPGTTTVAIGAAFWGFLIIGIVTQIILVRRRKRWYIIHHIDLKQNSKRRIGLLTFASNKYALIADILVILSLGGLIVSVVLTQATGFICYGFLAALCFTFCLHCILNGKIFYHITHHFEEHGKHERTSREKA